MSRSVSGRLTRQATCKNGLFWSTRKQAISRTMRPAHRKEMLLPLSTTKVRSLSIENHLGLATVYAGRADFDQTCCLIRVVCLEYFMRGETVAGEELEPLPSSRSSTRRVHQTDRPRSAMPAARPSTGCGRTRTGAARRAACGRTQVLYLEAWDRLRYFVTGGNTSQISVIAAG